MVEHETTVFANTDIKTLEEWATTKKVLDSKVFRYDWSQTNTNVFLTIYRKGVKSEDFFYFIKKKFVFLTIKLNDEEIYNLKMNTFSSILPEETKINITPMKVEVVLYKEVLGLKWDDITYKDNKNSLDISKKESLNSFSEKSSAEWNQLVLHEQQEEERAESAVASVEQFFKRLYMEADEDTKRAMVKSFQTSNGTVLSTNWKEVQKANYAKQE